MDSTELVLRLIELLDKVGAPYMLVGSYSSNYCGRPRSTNGADFVVTITADQLERLASDLGPDFRLDRQMSFETVTMTSRYVITTKRVFSGGGRSTSRAARRGCPRRRTLS